MIRAKNGDITRNVPSPLKRVVIGQRRSAHRAHRVPDVVSSDIGYGKRPSPAAQPPEVSPGGDEVLSTVVVTGTTSKRTLLDSSVAITSISNEDLQQKSAAQYG